MIGFYIKYNVNYVHSLALKTNFNFEPYHRILTNYHHRSVITKFRIISSHRLKVEIGRYQNIPKEDRICTLCDKNDVQDSFSFWMSPFKCTKT